MCTSSWFIRWNHLSKLSSILFFQSDSFYGWRLTFLKHDYQSILRFPLKMLSVKAFHLELRKIEIIYDKCSMFHVILVVHSFNGILKFKIFKGIFIMNECFLLRLISADKQYNIAPNKQLKVWNQCNLSSTCVDFHIKLSFMQPRMKLKIVFAGQQLLWYILK